MDNSFKDEKEFLSQFKNRQIDEKALAPFLKECNRLKKRIKEYSTTYQALYDTIVQDIVRYEYGVGGEMLYRGYYCPSPVLDIVVGGIKRGKLLKRMTSRSKPTYEYGFNTKDELIICNHIHLTIGESTIKEFIMRQDNMETSISFNPIDNIETISECVYCNNKIISYKQALYLDYDQSITEYTEERYTYSSNGLRTMDFFKLAPDISLLTHDQYIFKHDQEGYLSEYYVTEFSGEKVENPADEVYNIDVKRKV